MKKIIQNKLNNYFKIKKTRKRGIHKTKRNIQMKVREFFYPSIGFLAWSRYIFLSLNRKPASSHSLALGFAIGAWISFTPFIGLHGLGSIALAYMFSGSLVAALIGTLVGNPWTFPFIWQSSFKYGNVILGRDNLNQGSINLKEMVDNLLQNFSMDSFMDNILYLWDKFILPMFIGGQPAGIIVGIFFYFLLKHNIDKFRQIRANRIAQKKAERRAQHIKKIKDTFSIKGKQK